MSNDKEQLRAVLIIVIIVFSFILVRSLFGFYSSGAYPSEDNWEEIRG